MGQAEKFKAEDEAAKAKVEAKNGLESVLYQMKNQLAEKVPSVKEYIDKQILWLEDNQSASTEEYNAKTKEVQEFVQKEMAKQQPQGGPNRPAEPEQTENIFSFLKNILRNNKTKPAGYFSLIILWLILQS